jgi:hypothetical protein
MLIIALGVLTLMAILGAAFVSLVRLEKRATENYIDAKRMDLLHDSALERVIAQLHGAKNFRSFTQWTDTPWLNLFQTRPGKTDGDLAHGRADVEDDAVGTWSFFSEHAGRNYSYKTKVIDCAAQINLNGRQDTLARMLDNLGRAIESSSRLKINAKKIRIRNPLHSRPNGEGQLIKGQHLLQLRQRLDRSRFASKSQIRLLIGPENYDIIKDFVTCHSWEDPYTYKATDGEDEVRDVSASLTSAGVGGAGAGGQRQPVAYGVPRLDPEPRHPININTAPEEVLVACFMGLAGRRVFPHSKLEEMVDVDTGATILGQRVASIGTKEEVRDITPRAVFVYSPPLQYSHALRLAQRFIAQRKTRPFMTWRTNDSSQPGFEDYVDGLDESFFPAAQSCIVIDPDRPQYRQVEAEVMRRPSSLVGRLWQKGHNGSVRSLRQQLGLGFHQLNAWYFELIKGVIKANFNPNSRINRYNPNTPVYIPVDKSDLVWARDFTSLLKGHTTEFCFDTNGVYEVTTLGRIAQLKQTKGGAATVVEGASGKDAFERINYEKKTRSIVKVFNVLRHTNQLHFAKTFSVGSRSSANDRKNVVTWPDATAALTELVSLGSKRDGRVELVGLLDGLSLQTPLTNRINTLRERASALKMAHTFMIRDARSIARLQRASTQGIQSRLKEEYTDALRDVLDAPYTIALGRNREYYRRADLVSQALNINPTALYLDPLVNQEVLGTDIFPDGFLSSLLLTSHLQARVLALPALQKMGVAGQGDRRTGATRMKGAPLENMGNVPYYTGALGFWVKFVFDGDDPVFSGLIGCTQVIEEVRVNAGDFEGSEGTQFFVFKNSRGQLRVVRMYYHQAFPEGAAGGEGGGGEEGGVRLYPESSEAGSAVRNPILDFVDPLKLVSRSDLMCDISHFKAREWHHIGIQWDDKNPSQASKLFIDFQEANECSTVFFAQQIVEGVPNSWVRLNERQPRDSLQIGAIIRDQGEADAGVFKWFTNTTSTSGGGAAIQTIAPSVKRILANATIDEVAVANNFGAMRQYYSAQGAPGYFSQQPGEYANVFEIALPPDVDHVVLRSFDWTSYYPTMYTDSTVNSVPARLTVTPIQCQLTYNSPEAPPGAFFEPWRQPTVANRVGGRACYRRQTGLKGDNANLVYKFRMSGGRPSGGTAAGGVVQTPVIDDVTLTYFLPSPKVILQEEVDWAGSSAD